jgi:hypothetical protein
MATWTKQLANHCGRSRRCGWQSSCALVLDHGTVMPVVETKPQSSAITITLGDFRSMGARAAGPPG